MTAIADCPISGIYSGFFFKIRRYLEIARLYERCGMTRAASFYKWVSTGRVFRLIQHSQSAAENSNSDGMNLKRILSKSISNMMNIIDFSFMVKLPTSSRNDNSGYENGFPSVKKRILNEIIKLYHYNNSIENSIK